MGERTHYQHTDAGDPVCGTRAQENLWSWTFTRHPRLVTCPGCRAVMRLAGIMLPAGCCPMLGGETGEERCRVTDDADWNACRAAMATCGPDGIAYFDDDTKCTAEDARWP